MSATPQRATPPPRGSSQCTTPAIKTVRFEMRQWNLGFVVVITSEKSLAAPNDCTKLGEISVLRGV